MSAWFVLGAGPSLCVEDVDAIRGRGTVVAVNCAVMLAPWADVLYACDLKWWETYPHLWREFAGERVSCQPECAARGVRVVRKELGDGLGVNGIRTGSNGGHQAINLAALRGATSIVLLGFDQQHTGGRAHFHPDHPGGMSNFPPQIHQQCITAFGALASDAQARGIRIINASRQTALRCFERMSLPDVIAALNPASPVARAARSGSIPTTTEECSHG